MCISKNKITIYKNGGNKNKTLSFTVDGSCDVVVYKA
jgi:hypothetical protein